MINSRSYMYPLIPNHHGLIQTARNKPLDVAAKGMRNGLASEGPQSTYHGSAGQELKPHDFRGHQEPRAHAGHGTAVSLRYKDLDKPFLNHAHRFIFDVVILPNRLRCRTWRMLTHLPLSTTDRKDPAIQQL